MNQKIKNFLLLGNTPQQLIMLLVIIILGFIIGYIELEYTQFFIPNLINIYLQTNFNILIDKNNYLDIISLYSAFGIFIVFMIAIPLGFIYDIIKLKKREEK